MMTVNLRNCQRTIWSLQNELRFADAGGEAKAVIDQNEIDKRFESDNELEGAHEQIFDHFMEAMDKLDPPKATKRTLYTQVSDMQNNWPEILGVSPGATDEQIKLAYRKKMSKGHFDKSSTGGLSPEALELEELHSQQAAVAYNFVKQRWVNKP